MDAAHAHAYLRADLQEREADTPAGGAGKLGPFQPEAARGAHEHIGEGGEVQAQLVGEQRLGAGAIGEQVELLLLVAVLDLPVMVPP
jgi:hypothetical protein